MNHLSSLCCLLLFCGGCQQKQTDVVDHQNDLEIALNGLTALTYIHDSAIFDGGSIAFFFDCDTGSHLSITLLHHISDLGGNPAYQVVKVSGAGMPNEADLSHGSKAEMQLLQLIQDAKIDISRYTSLYAEKPTTGKLKELIDRHKPSEPKLRWLAQRIRDRSINWSYPEQY